MFVDTQANYAPIAPEQLLERPLEPGVAYAVDPDGTDEVDDAISVKTEPARNGKLSTHVTTYIADTALFDVESKPFAIAKERLFSDYHESHTDHMLPAEVLGHLSLDNGIEQGAPAIAVRTRIHSGRTALVGIERVRVLVNAVTYGQFEELVQTEADPGALDVVKASNVISGLCKYQNNEHGGLNAHRVVGNHMVMANRMLAQYACRNNIPWIYRFYKGDGAGRTGRHSPWAHYTQRPRLHWGVGDGTEGVLYCHGTSPLRRFPDMVNQLALSAHIGGDEPPFGVDEVRNFSIAANTKMRQMLGSQAALSA